MLASEPIWYESAGLTLLTQQYCILGLVLPLMTESCVQCRPDWAATISIVNCKWIYDCVRQWKILPSGVSFMFSSSS